MRLVRDPLYLTLVQEPPLLALLGLPSNPTPEFPLTPNAVCGLRKKRGDASFSLPGVEVWGLTLSWVGFVASSCFSSFCRCCGLSPSSSCGLVEDANADVERSSVRVFLRFRMDLAAPPPSVTMPLESSESCNKRA